MKGGDGQVHIFSHFVSFSRVFTTRFSILERYHNKPVCTHPLENMTVVVGSNVNLTCTFLSHLNPYISWTRQYNATYAVVVQV